jgi:hypothetical protein
MLQLQIKNHPINNRAFYLPIALQARRLAQFEAALVVGESGAPPHSQEGEGDDDLGSGGEGGEGEGQSHLGDSI